MKGSTLKGLLPKVFPFPGVTIDARCTLFEFYLECYPDELLTSQVSFLLREFLIMISAGIGELFYKFMINFYLVLIFVNPKSMIGSVSLTMGPLKSAMHWKVTGGPSSISTKK